MSETLNYKSRTADGTTHAVAYRGQLKWLAAALAATIIIPILAATFTANSAINRCTAPCFTSMSAAGLVVAPAGYDVAIELRMTGAFAIPKLRAATPNSTLPLTSVPVPQLGNPSGKAPVLSARVIAKPATRATTIAQPKSRPAHKAAAIMVVAMQTSMPALLHKAVWSGADRP